MEGWQKGAQAVLKFSKAGKEKYFKQFPEREGWFKQNYPEHFGRSVTAATTSLKKTNTAKQQQQRLSVIRQAAEKRDQLKVSSAAVQAMGARRRESGEGLGGGLQTNRDIIAHVRGGGTIGSGGLGSLFEQKVETPDVEFKDGKYYFNGAPYNSEKEANAARDKFFRNEVAPSVGGLSSGALDTMLRVGGLGFIPGAVADVARDSLSIVKGMFSGDGGVAALDAVKKRRQAEGNWGKDWPTPEEDTTDWYADLTPKQKQELTKKMKERSVFTTDAERMAKLTQDFSPRNSSGTKQIDKYQFDEESIKDMNDETEEVKNAAKVLAEKILANKLHECMPMGMMVPESSDDMENSSEAKDEPGEYDYEGDMAKSQLRSIAYNAKMLHDMLEDNTNLPEWVQSKITLAEDYMLTAANYMRGELKRMDEEVEQIEEGFDTDPADIAAYLVDKHGSGVTMDHIEAYERGRDSHRPIEKHEVMKYIKKMTDEPPFDPNATRAEMPPGKHPEGFRRARQLARQALKSQILSMQQPASAEDLVAQHNDLHNTISEGDVVQFRKKNSPQTPMEIVSSDKERAKQMADAAKNARTAEELKASKVDAQKNTAQKTAGRWATGKEGTLTGAITSGVKEIPPTVKSVAGKTLALASIPSWYNLAKNSAGLVGTGPADSAEKIMNTPINPMVASAGLGVDPRGLQYLLHQTSAGQALRNKMAAWDKTPDLPDPLAAPVGAVIAPMFGQSPAAGWKAGWQTTKDQYNTMLDYMKTNEQVENDLVTPGMLPDKPTIPQGKGFGDDIKKDKIVKKTEKAIVKKRNALPTDNPSENELVPQSMLPDQPGYPPGHIVPKPLEEEKVESTESVKELAEENPYVAASATFLTKTSARLVYGEKND